MSFLAYLLVAKFALKRFSKNILKRFVSWLKKKAEDASLLPKSL